MAEVERTSDGRLVETRRGGNMGWLIALLVVVALVVAAFAFGLIDLDADAGKVPDVNVTTSGGEAPSIDADVADIDVGTRETTVEVPTVRTEEKSIELPTVDVNRADEAKADNN